MKNAYLMSGFILSGLVALPAAAQEKKQDKPVETPKPQVYKLGSTVDEGLTLVDLDGKELRFKDLRGKVVLIHFWSTLCPYEVAAEPKILALEKRWKDRKDFVILAIDSNSTEIGIERPKESPGYEAIREHMKKKGLSFPVYVDHGNKIADLFQAQTTPHCFVLDKKGVIVYAGALDDDPKGDKGEALKPYARDAVEAALEGNEVSTKETKPYG